MSNREEFEKNLKKDKIYLILGILFFAFSAISAVIIYLNVQKEMKDVVPLADVKTEGKYASVDVQVMTDYFATEDSTAIEHKSYFVWDDKYIYIVDLNDETREKLNEIYDYSYNQEEDAVAPATVTIKGMTKTIPSNLKKIAIDSYNKLFSENLLTSSNFSTYLGVVYLNTFESPMTSLPMKLVGALPTFVIGVILLIVYLTRSRTTKKSIEKLENKWEQVLKEVDSTDAIFYKKAKLYLTRNYLISYLNGLEVYDYKDIVWVYPHEYRYNGSVSQKSIFVVTKNSKAHKLATVSASKKNLVLFDEMYNTFTNRMPDALSGYTKENKEKAKEMYQK